MPSDAGDRRASSCPNGSPSAAAQHHPPPPNSEALPCPRCDSINTKFCYYNNYNLAQPRHFCKSCRRYWTQGGTLRNVPVGGGSRKSSTASTSSSKRLRSIHASAGTTLAPPSASSAASTSSSLTSDSNSFHPAPTFFKPDAISRQASELPPGAFTSLFTSPGGNGFLALGGGGGGYGQALDGLGHGFSRAVWPFAEVGYIEGVYAGCPGTVPPAATAPPGNTWHLGGGEVGVGTGGSGQVDGTGDGFAWPELAISMPGQGLK